MTIEQVGSTALAIEPEQATFSPAQVAALEQIGAEHVPPGDLEVFFHVCKRSGLDPFARQIHLVGRRVYDNNVRDYVTKHTIQTGIDGYRLIGRRAADRAHETISVDPPQWAHRDGGWRDLWDRDWGTPLAARVTVRRNGEPFTAVAMFSEYAQTKKGGDLNAMWSQRPAGQIAKCAEALAWRMAFPQDMSSVYTDEEMGQADNPPPRPRSGLAAAKEALGSDVEEVIEAVPVAPQVDPAEPVTWPEDELLDVTSKLAKALFKGMADAGIPKEQAHDFMSETLGRDVESSTDLTVGETRRLLRHLPNQEEG